MSFGQFCPYPSDSYKQPLSMCLSAMDWEVLSIVVVLNSFSHNLSHHFRKLILVILNFGIHLR